MLTKRVVACMDVRDGRVVKNYQYFTPLPDAGDPVSLAAVYNEQGADELIFLDITASVEGRGLIRSLVEATADQVFIPLTVAGGIRTVADMHDVLQSGADKVAVNSAAPVRPELITEGADMFGTQCIVVAIDARWERDDWYVYIRGGRQATGRRASEWAREAQERGAGEILLTSIDRDGTGDGYDLGLLRSVSSCLSIPVVASGGAATPEHFVEAVVDGGADAVLAASMFHYGRYTVEQCKTAMRSRGLPVRL